MTIKNLCHWFLQKTNLQDVFLLFLFTCFVLWNPYYLYQHINLFELGLYLPGIGAVLDGQIPYRDFFHLRGPFELVVPAMMMKVFGEHVAVLSTYFYVGNVLCLLICMLIAYRIFPQRWVLYSFVPVLIARTYPRVVYTYWGGFRYVWGLLAVYCLVEFILRKQKSWIFAAGVLTAIAGLTSMEVGVCAGAAILVGIFLNQNRCKHLVVYMSGIVLIAIPCFIYLFINNAWGDYVHSQWLVATQMTQTFLQTEPVPSNFLEICAGLFDPANKNFRQMTPVYAYIFFAVYWWRQRGLKQISLTDHAISGMAVYGFLLYVTGFRNLWASVFEMSLQPEKIVLFYLLFKLSQESVFGLNKKVCGVLMAAVLLSSIGYSFDRFNKRFLFFRKIPFKNESAEFVNLPRIKNMKVPAFQAEDFQQLSAFIEKYTTPGEKVWMYPELGAFHFIFHRPPVGKFPTATLAWMDEGEYVQYMKDLSEHPPRFAIANKQTPDYFEKSYFPVEGNAGKYQEQMNFLKDHYRIIQSTPTYHMYEYQKYTGF